MPWNDINKALDELPCFVVVANGCAVPSDSGRTELHVDMGTALKQLESARAQSPESDFQLQPVGLGFALTSSGGGPPPSEGASADGAASLLVPSAHDVQRARALPGSEEVDWDAGAVPLFGCFELQQLEQASGKLVRPLFLAHADAAAALDAAEEQARRAPSSDGAAAPQLRMRATSLQLMTQRMAGGDTADPRAFRFVAPSSAVRFCASLQSEASTDGALPELSDADARRALTMIYDDKRRARPARDAGLFPDF